MLQKLKKFDGTSWYPVLIGGLVVWILSCCEGVSEFVAAQKNTLAVLIVVCYIIFAAYIIFVKEKRDTQTILWLIFLGSFFIRAYYVLAAPYGITLHDIGHFSGLDTEETAGGHFGYIDYLYKNHHLPDFDPRTRWSFYNPPGFYILEAVVLGITRIFRVSEPLCYESLQVTTFVFSSLTVWTGYRILKEFSISDKWLLWMTALLSFHPFFSIMAVTLTNDCMTMYLMALAIWYTLRWQKNPELKNIIVIAAALGLAMFTKVNAGILAFGIGTVFLIVFWKNRKEWKKYILQFAIFLIICAPIGLFSPIRNLVKYDMPLAYVQQVTREDWKFIADQTLIDCIGFPSLENLSHAFVTFDPTVEKNAWIQMFRTALYDEIMPDVGNSLFGACAYVLLWISMLLILLMNLAFLWSIYKKDVMNVEQKAFFAVSYLAFLISYVSFSMSEPFTFTMEYRYIPVAIFFPLIGTSVWLQKQQEEKQLEKKGYRKNLKNILLFGIAAFVVLAIVIQLDLIAWSDIRL